MPRRKQKIKYSRKNACKHLRPKGDFSNALQPLCICEERELVLGIKSYVCQVCYLYTQTNRTIPELYEESRKLAEKKIKDQKEALELEKILDEDEIDLGIDEFEEDESDLPIKYEKRKAGKEDLEDSEEFAEVECPFCGELFDNLTTHIQECEFAPEDASLEDIVPSRKKKKKKSSKGDEDEEEESGDEKDKRNCPYCGKQYARLGRHIKACKKRPATPDEEKEAAFLKGEIDKI